MWWSVATENMNMSNKSWICTWCGHMHSPPHDINYDKLGPPITKDDADRGSW